MTSLSAIVKSAHDFALMTHQISKSYACIRTVLRGARPLGAEYARCGSRCVSLLASAAPSF